MPVLGPEALVGFALAGPGLVLTDQQPRFQQLQDPRIAGALAQRCRLDPVHRTQLAQQERVLRVHLDGGRQLRCMGKPLDATDHPGAAGQQAVQLETGQFAGFEPEDRAATQPHGDAPRQLVNSM